MDGVGCSVSHVILALVYSLSMQLYYLDYRTGPEIRNNSTTIGNEPQDGSSLSHDQQYPLLAPLKKKNNDTLGERQIFQ